MVLFCIVGVSITNILVNSVLLQRPREKVVTALTAAEYTTLSYLFTCMMCAGFWCGMIIAPLFGINIFIGAATISILSQFYGLIVSLIEAVSDFYIVKTDKL
jgi:hypothetical protein